MKETFDLSINIYCNKYKDISVDDFFLEILNASRSVDIIVGKSHKWYLTGNTKKNAYKTVVFDGKNNSQECYNIVSKHSSKNEDMINESIWNGESNGSACSISHYMKFVGDHKKLNLSIDINQRPSEIDNIIDAMHILVKNKKDAWIMVDSKCYWLNEKNVFPDRAYVGWMIYIPHIILPELIPEAAKILPVMNEGNQKGTIIISTCDIFDGSKKEHIEKANDIEIRLLDIGMLPLMTEI